MPPPQLSVASRSAVDSEPARRTTSKTGAGVQVPRSMVTETSSGTTRARLAASPPPVTWAIAWTPVSSASARHALA